MQINQLFNTVKKSASVAAYLDNQELANEVTEGLTYNDLVLGARITTNTGMNIISGDMDLNSANHFILFELASPFMPDENAGAVTLHPNHILIEENARQAAKIQAITIAAHSSVIVILVIFLVNYQLTSPLKRLIESLHKIEPGSDQRLDCPERNKEDELGQLVKDTNLLLTSAQNTLEGERRLRMYMEALEKRFRLIFEKASSGIVLIDTQGKFVLYNSSFQSLLPEDKRNQLESTQFSQLFTDSEKVIAIIKQAREQAAPINLDLELNDNEGNRWLHVLFSTVEDEQGNQLIECILYDISERAERERRTKRDAERDPLTQLYNRRAGEQRIEETLQTAKASARQFAIMLIDLDKFKPINDTYGHDAGDKVLTTVAQRLTDCIRQTDTVIRWGGDEFLVVVQQGHEILDPGAVAEKLIAALQEDIDIGGHINAQVGASIGIAVYPVQAQTATELIDLSDKAMYQVKQQGRNGYHIYSDDPSQKIVSANQG